MNDYPQFMKNPLNKIAGSSQYAEDIEGYVFDGRDGSQAAFWISHKDRKSSEHAHDYDEYMVVVQGEYTLIIEDKKISLAAGQEYLIPKCVAHSGECLAGTRTIHVFGGKRVERERDNDHLSGHRKE
jgi:mannose-6-phosphate isomerase-like protein (cupin superfamily)